jgi:hypothetical protein
MLETSVHSWDPNNVYIHTTHHQERKELYLQHLAFVTPLLLPDDLDTVPCAPDDGRLYHLKHVEQFPDKINCITLHLV